MKGSRPFAFKQGMSADPCVQALLAAMPLSVNRVNLIRKHYPAYLSMVHNAEIPASASSAEGSATSASTASEPLAKKLKREHAPGSSGAAQSMTRKRINDSQEAEHSAEQPVVKVESVQDVRRWLATEDVINSSIDIGCVREAIAVLTKIPRPRKEDVRPLQSK